MANVDSPGLSLPEDHEILRTFVQTLLAEREQQKQQAEAQQGRTAQLEVELLRLQVKLERYKR